MNKLNKTQIAERDDVAGKLRTAFDDLQAAVDKYNNLREANWDIFSKALEVYNSDMEEAWAEVQTALDEYNGEALCTARDWRDRIVSDIDEYMGERSDKWLEGDKGQAISAWKDQFDEISMEDISLDMPEPIDVEEPEELSFDDDNPADELEQSQEEAEG